MFLHRVVVCGCLASLPALAQGNPYGRVTGRVLDASGAVVVGASVRLVQTETNIATTTTTSHEGVYEALNLLPGNYRIQVEMQGFKRHERGPIEVRVGDILGIDIQLELGALAETITVEAEAPLLESTTASLGQTIDNKKLSDLPLGGRGLSYLMQLTPGVVATNAPTHGWLPQARGSVSNIATLGTRTRSSEFTLDGVPNMEQGGTIAFQPPPEMISEFRVQTAAFDASLGHFTGSHVNMVIKAGGNAYHGALWFSHLSRPLMTHPFFVNRSLYDTRTGPPTDEKRGRLWPPTKTNRYRGNVAGPVILPKLYDGRNRTFFSYGNDFMLRIFAGSGFNTVPTIPQRSGDFSDLLALGGRYQIYDPATIAAAPNGRFSRQPLPGNRIPASRVDPLARKLLDFYPLPNVAGTADFRNNFTSPPANRIDYESHIFRADQVVTPNHRFYASFSTWSVQGDQGRNFRNNARGSLSDSQYYGFVLDDVWMARPNLVFNARYGLTRRQGTSDPTSVGLDLGGLGFAPGLVSMIDPALRALPTIDIDGLLALNTENSSFNANTYHFFSGTATNIRGSHSLRMGGEYRILQENAYNYGRAVPEIVFGSQWTRGPLDSSPPAPIGQGLASFLLGVPTGGFMDRNASYAEQSSYMGFFVHDDWKATRRLTINMGLRYEYEIPTTERFNRANRGFDFDTTNPVLEAARANYARNPIPELPVSRFTTNGGLLFAAAGGQPRGTWDRDRNNFSPRLGMAYQATRKLVLRAGYGVYFESLGSDRIDVAQQGFSQRTSLVPSNDNGVTFRASLANPFPDGLLDAAGTSGGLRTFLGRAPSFFTPGRRTGYMQRWSLTTQYQIGGRMIVELGYTGNRGTKLGRSINYNAVPAQYLSTSPLRDQAAIDFLTGAVRNPFFGIPDFQGSSLQGINVPRQQLLTARPQFTGVNTTLSDGFSWYHGGHIRLEKRMTRGYTLSGSYTWSKFMEAVDLLNAQDLHPHHVISPQDRPHHIAISGTWDMPWAQKKLWGGWSINAIYQWQSGAPVNWGNILFLGDIKNIPIPRSEQQPERFFNTEAGFVRDPRLQLAGNLRTFPLRLAGVRQHHWNWWDISVFKNFRINERVQLQLRAEAVDAFNSPMFNPPNAAPVNTLFGQSTNTIWSEQRKITVAGKMIF